MEYVRNVIDGYRMIKKSGSMYIGDRSKDITIVFYSNGKIYTESRYHRIPNCRVKKIREKLDDLISYNNQVEDECQAISFITILHFVGKLAFSD